MRSKNWEVGETWTYPSDYGFGYVCKLPEIVAVEWAKSVGMTKPDNPQFVDEDLSPRNWLNKKFVIVDIDPIRGKVLAVYKHDFFFWLISNPMVRTTLVENYSRRKKWK